jgi:hypothetical protein
VPRSRDTNILRSGRNRPADLAHTGEDDIPDAALAYFRTGDEPTDVADLVLEAVERDDFYVLTSEAARQDLQARNEAIAQLRQPPRPRPESITPAGDQAQPADSAPAVRVSPLVLGTVLGSRKRWAMICAHDRCSPVDRLRPRSDSVEIAAERASPAAVASTPSAPARQAGRAPAASAEKSFRIARAVDQSP